MVEMSTHSGVIQNAKPAHNGETLIYLCYHKEMGNTVGSTSSNLCNFSVLNNYFAKLHKLEFVPCRD